MPRSMRPTVYGLNTSNDRRSRFTGPWRRSRVGHLAPSRTVPTVVRLKPGISEQRPSGKASMWLKGKSAVSKAACVFSQHDAERSDAARPHHVGERAGLRAAFHPPFVDRPQLVHVIRLVGATAGVVETEQPGDQQGALVVSDRVGAGKHAAGFSVKCLAVGEEQAAFGRELTTDLRPLSDVTLGQHGPARHAGALGDDEAVRLHAGADQGRSFRTAEYRAVDQRSGSVDDRGRAHVHVDHFGHRADRGSDTDPSPTGMCALGGVSPQSRAAGR